MLQPYLDFGGSERVMLRIAAKFNPVIYTCRYDKARTHPEFSDYDVRILPKSALEAPARAFGRLDSDIRMRDAAGDGMRFLRAKIRDDYDVLNPHLMPSEWIRERNERVCWYCHCPCRPAYGWKGQFMSERNLAGKVAMGAAVEAYRLVEGSIASKIEKICVNSSSIRENVRRNLGRESVVAYPGIEPREFACDDYGKTIFYPSRIVPEKRLEYAIMAFKKARLKGWKLVIGGHLSPIERNIKYLAGIKELAKGAGIELLVNIPEKGLRRHYAACSIVLFAAMNEDWGIVPLEAMASSKPVISVNEGGPRESIVDGKTGFLVNSVDEMAQRMRFLAENRDACERMGKAGRRRVEQNYTWKIFLDRMERAFKQTAKM
jgi:glycosyltransferase involved in cell wall biosynthesis